jgi:two-component SAPR family response regulator
MVGLGAFSMGVLTMMRMMAIHGAGPSREQAVAKPMQPPRATAPFTRDVVNEWQLVVRVFGHPQVENFQGESAEFRKKRALELVTWLSLNPDRRRRSTARTAMWESDVTDSTFATIVSDMRRGLSSVVDSEPRELVPPTYSDVLTISPTIVSEVDLLNAAHQRFRSDASNASELADILSKVRDMPFAGVNYEWADYDGTTTRLVMLVLSACTDLARFAIESGDIHLLHIATAAGLRVMPGNEVLLSLQRKLQPF